MTDPANVILLTATIKPRAGVPNLMRTDPAVRLKDYAGALQGYLALVGRSVDAVVFAENSNADLTALRDLAARAGLSARVEFLSFDGLDYPQEYDRGYGEFKLVDFAMTRSRLIAEWAKAAHGVMMWKITGRYSVGNLAAVIRTRQPGCDLCCNFRNLPICLVDMYLMGWTPAGYERYLRGVYEDLKVNVPGVPSGTVPEQRLRAQLDRFASDRRIQRRFGATPNLSGYRGGDNRGYATENRWKFHVRRTARLVAPALWI